MSNDIAIRVNGLGKRYRIAHETASYKTLGETITRAVKAPFRRLTGEAPSRSTEEFWALKDVSFEVKRGEVVGIIGRNGAGKSTLLKILSRITTPTEGTVEVHGRIGSLLEVGTGFHPELSGRENIYLSGSILGMKRSEIDSKFDEIVKFAEMEKFLDTPVKRYSSGMYVRLAFAVAAHLEPEILIIDEVLAVGDAAFQKKCLGKMGDVANEGRTVLFVSHNIQAVSSLCHKCILIENGVIGCSGQTIKVIEQYLGHNKEAQTDQLCWKAPLPNTIPFSDILMIDSFSIRDQAGNIAVAYLKNSCDYYATIEIELKLNDPRLIFELIYYSGEGQILFSTDIHDSGGVNFGMMKPGKYLFKVPVPVNMFVNDNIYELELISVLHLTAWILPIGNQTKLRFKFIRELNTNPYNYEKNLASLNPQIRWEVLRSD